MACTGPRRRTSRKARWARNSRRRRAEGYLQPGSPKGAPFHGYVYRLLESQGPNAPGGAYDYVAHGEMFGGFGLIAFPAEYGSSGVMTFIVNQDGVVYSRDLGPNTQRVAMGIVEFNPDSMWTKEDGADALQRSNGDIPRFLANGDRPAGVAVAEACGAVFGRAYGRLPTARFKNFLGRKFSAAARRKRLARSELAALSSSRRSALPRSSALPFGRKESQPRAGRTTRSPLAMRGPEDRPARLRRHDPQLRSRSVEPSRHVPQEWKRSQDSGVVVLADAHRSSRLSLPQQR